MKKLLFVFLGIIWATVAQAQFADQRQFASTTGGSANAQTINIPNYALNVGVVIRAIPSITNTGAMTLSVNGTTAKNVLKISSGGLTALTGGEIVVGQIAQFIYDGTQYELVSIGISSTASQTVGATLWQSIATTPLPAGYPTTPCGNEFGSEFYNFGFCAQTTGAASAHSAGGSGGSGPYGGQLAELYVVHNTDGSGAFGTAYADFGLSVSETKNNYLTSTNPGELDVMDCRGWQGAQGDSTCMQAEMIKVRGSGSDTGAVVGLGDIVGEFISPASTVTSPVITWLNHSLISYGEACCAGPSNGQGYGYWTESWVGPQYSAFYASTHNYLSGAPGTYGYIFLLGGTHDGAAADQYFSVGGDQIASQLGFPEQPGDINQGLATYAINLHTDGAGSWGVRHGVTYDFVLTSGIGYFQAGVQTPILQVVSMPTSAGSGGLYVCVDSSGNTYKKSACP